MATTRAGASGVEGVTFTVNGKRSGRKLGYPFSLLAFQHSVGLSGKARLGVADFTKYLSRHHGIKDPFAKSFDIVLANGHRIGAIVGGKPAKAPTQAELDTVGSARRASKPRAAKAPKATEAPAATAAPRAPREPREPTPPKSGALSPQARSERRRLAVDEAKAVKEWETAGSEGERPVTPNLDSMNAEFEAKEAAGKAQREAVKEQGGTVASVPAPAKATGRKLPKAS